MNSPLKYKDKYGQYSLWIEDKVMMSEVKGQVGLSMAKRFCKDFLHLAKDLNLGLWAYYSDLTQCDAYIEEARNCFNQAYEYGEVSNCVADVYLIKSPLLISQTEKLRQANGISDPIQGVVFDTKKECLEFIERNFDETDNTV